MTKILHLFLKITGILSLVLILLFAMLYATGSMGDEYFRGLVLGSSVLWFICIPLSGRIRK